MRLLLCFTSMLLLAAPAFADEEAPKPQPHVHHKSKFTLDETKTASLPECPACTECSECPAVRFKCTPCTSCPACDTSEPPNVETVTADGFSSTLVRLHHASAEAVAAKVSEQLKQEFNLNAATANGVVVKSPVIIVPNATTNTLVVLAASQYQEAIEEMIAQSDVEPKRFNVRIRMQATTGDGENNANIVVSPTISALEGTPTAVEIVDGHDGKYRFEVEVTGPGEVSTAAADTAMLDSTELVLMAPGEELIDCPVIRQARALRMMMGAISKCDGDACSSEKEAAASDSASADSDACACENCDCKNCACSTGSCSDGACASSKECACSSSNECACSSAKQCECASCEKCSSCPECTRAAAKQCACSTSKECACASAKSKCNCSTAASARSKCEQSECPACASKSDACPAECLAAMSAAGNCFDSGCERTACTASANCECEHSGCPYLEKNKIAAVAIYCHQIMKLCPHSKYEAAARAMLNDLQADGKLSCSSDDDSRACKCESCACADCDCSKCACTECPDASAAIAECPGTCEPCDVPAIMSCARADEERICTPAPIQAAEAPMIKVELGAGGPLLTITGPSILQTASESAADNSECNDAACESRRIQLAGHRALSTDEHAAESAGNALTTTVYPIAEIVGGDDALLSSEQLIHLIKHTVEPGSWDDRGGEGTIEDLATSLSLVIRQNDGEQTEISKLIKQLSHVSQLRQGISSDADEVRSVPKTGFFGGRKSKSH